jgi:hypothetical protein
MNESHDGVPGVRAGHGMGGGRPSLHPRFNEAGSMKPRYWHYWIGLLLSIALIPLSKGAASSG